MSGAIPASGRAFHILLDARLSGSGHLKWRLSGDGTVGDEGGGTECQSSPHESNVPVSVFAPPALLPARRNTYGCSSSSPQIDERP